MLSFQETVLSVLRKTHNVRLFKHDDAPTLQIFLNDFEDFFILCEGTQPNAVALLTDHPVEKNPDLHKGVFGFYEADHLFGLVDLIQNYPEEGTWTIGYLLVHPAHRQKGRGSSLVKTLETLGAKKLRCIVQQQNPNALSFWKTNGFIPVRTLANGTSVCEKSLG